MNLLNASETGDIEKVILFLNSGVNVNKDNYGETPLHLASINGFLEIVKVLLQNRAEINIKDNYGNTPLHLASIYGHLDIVKELLLHKAEINILNNYGYTPLHWASYYGYLDIVKLLLQHRAEINIKNIDGNTPIFYFLNHKELSKYYANELFTYIFLLSKKLQAKYFGTNCLLSIFESLLSKENINFLELYYNQKEILNIIIHISTEEKYKTDRTIPDFKTAVIEYANRKLNL